MELKVALVVMAVGILMLASPTTPLAAGAPTSVCGSMTPGHGTESTATLPYSITLNATTYKGGSTITVTVTGGQFQGILMQVREVGGGNTTYGSWSNVATNTKTLQCQFAADAVTHSNISPKQSGTTFTWNAPFGIDKTLQVRATVAQQQFTWWKGVTSASIVYTGSGTSTIVPPAHYILMVACIALRDLQTH